MALFCTEMFYSQNKTNYIIPKDYYVFDSAYFKNYQILALERKEKKNDQSGIHHNLPIIVLHKNIHSGTFEKIAENKKLVFSYDDNCPADIYGRLVIKGNFFTVEQIYCSDFLFVNSFTTFYIDRSNKIHLHQYGESYTDRSNPDKFIKDRVWTKKDFGSVSFEEVNENFLMHLGGRF